MKNIWCKLGFHSFVQIREQYSKNCGWGECGLPANRITEKCTKCGTLYYSSYNMAVPKKDLDSSNLWR
jgi:hypothetical protein